MFLCLGVVVAPLLSFVLFLIAAVLCLHRKPLPD